MTNTFQLQKGFDISDPAITENVDYSSCSLYLIVGDNYISYTILDKPQRNFFALKSYFFKNEDCDYSCRKQALEALIGEFGLRPETFGTVVLAVENDTYSLVPAPLYDPLLNEEYLKTLKLDQPGQLFIKDDISQPDIVTVYSIEHHFYEYIKEQLPNAIIRHAVSHVLAVLQREVNAADSKDALFVLVRQNHFYIVLFEKGSLVFEHAYYYEAALDIVYHVLNCLKQFRLEAEAVNVRLGGEISADSRIFIEMDKYIPQLSWLRRPEYFNYIPAFSEYPENYFYTLFAMGLCE